MRSYVPDFEFVNARDLNQALSLLSNGFQPFAGGTDIMVLFNAGKLVPKPLVGYPEIAGIERSIREA